MNRTTLRLPAAFIEYAKEFDVPPVLLAERILLKAAEERKAEIVLRARKSKAPRSGPH